MENLSAYLVAYSTQSTHSNLIITPSASNLLKATTMAVILSINPAIGPPKASNETTLSSQFYPWELENKIGAMSIPQPIIEEPNDFFDVYIKPIPVRQYKVKGRVRSVRKGIVH